MYQLQRQNGRDLWCAGIDEGYGTKPHIELNIGVVDGVPGRLRCLRENIYADEVPHVADMLRWLAHNLEETAKAIEARKRAAPTQSKEQTP
jgi:hypothetical protein